MLIEQLLQDYNIPIAPEGHKHRRAGWVNVACPFHHTDHPGFHLGITEDGRTAYCFSCGIHWVDETISKLLGISQFVAKKLIIEYAGTPIHSKEPLIHIRTKAHKNPGNTTELTNSHRLYLLNRKFKPDKLIQEWKILGTGPLSLLDHINYSRRIFIPIFWDERQVTFQTRDITNKHPLKYLACPESRELIKHKHIVYKHPEWNRDVCICTEGVTDVWRFGRCSVATFGIEYTGEQVRVMAHLFRRVAVCFDDEPQAVRQANELIADLRFRKVDAFRIDIVGDPGGMKQEDADYLVKQIIK